MAGRDEQAGRRGGELRRNPLIAVGRHAPSRGVDHAGPPRHHAGMESPKPPRQSPDDKDFDAKTQAWLELKREMELLHANVEYLRLILKMGVKLP